MKKALIILLAVQVLILSSCGTIFSGTKQSVQIRTFTEGANVEVDGVDRGVTPLTLDLKRGFKSPVITLSKEGYQKQEFYPELTFNNVSLLNLFGMFGFVIDAATGAIMKYDPKFYEVNLKEESKQSNL
ncbi:hypothetical protein GCM10022216_00140 [Sphingobacterium kyonggiense]|uniref:PEGA domain-containing protein n=1 Tax=Sphingobacterium kyonggiense TaxID=714075 RepID=A0ABP7Y5I0_9SPHI